MHKTDFKYLPFDKISNIDDFSIKNPLFVNQYSPFINDEGYFVSHYNTVKIFLSKQEVVDFEKNLIKKGNCSSDEAIQKIVDGEIYNSHSLPFHLYNYSALRIIEQFVPRNLSILELGCNNGLVSRLIQRTGLRFKEYWGMDFDFSFILDGLKKFGPKDTLFQCNFVTGNFNKPLNFEDEYFGLVYFQEAFDHCTDKFFYAEQIISEIKRVLIPEGYLYITLVFEHEHRDLYHWDHNFIWKKFEFENMIKDYFEIVNFTPLLTFGHTMQTSDNPDVQKAYKNWPPKFAKMICAHFVDENDTAVGSYLLKKNP